MPGGGLSVENFAKKFKQDFGKSLSDSARESLTEAFSDPDIVGDRGAFTKAVTDAVAPLFTPKADGTMRASPQINSGPMAELLRMAQQIRAELAAINGAAGSAKSAVAGIGSAPTGRGRSDVATATANLSRSRELNNTGRSFIGGYS